MADVSWFVIDRPRLDVGDLQPAGTWEPSPYVAATFPVLASLLRAACISSLRTGEDELILFSWEAAGEVSSWLCRPPSPNPPSSLFQAHAALLKEFGGVTERSGEFDESWLLNTSESLTVGEAEEDASFIEDYAWAFEDVPGGVPIDLAAYYSISGEANGNKTLCHRESGEVVLFARDHDFTHVLPFEGCPDLAPSLYRIAGASHFVPWVEAVAQQWSERRLGGRPTSA